MRIESRQLECGSGGWVSAAFAYPEGFRPRQTAGVILAHGAGRGMSDPLLSAVHEGLAARGFVGIKFNFPFEQRGRRTPDVASVLEDCYRRVIEAVRADPELRLSRLVIGGKSLGGRVASHLAAQGAPVDGLLLLGYPLHAPRRPEAARASHFAEISVPTLFFAGTRDSMCDLGLLRDALRALRAPTTLHVILDADHSFKLLKRAGRGQDEVHAEIVETCAEWMAEVVATPSPG